jgi:hypothetical protein
MRETSLIEILSPERLDHLVDLARRDAGDVRLLHDRDQRLLATPTRLQERREIAAAPNLRDRELDLPGPRLPGAQPVAVSVRESLVGRALAAAGPDELGDLGLHRLLADPEQALAQVVDAFPLEEVADDLVGRHPCHLGHRGAPFVDPWRDRRV